MELKCVAHKILNQLAHMCRVSIDGWQITVFDPSADLFYSDLHVGNNFLYHVAEVQRDKRLSFGGHARGRQQVVY